MNSSKETSGQRRERLEAQRISKEQAGQASKDKMDFEKEQAGIKEEGIKKKKRSLGMKGGGRKGLMYQGNEAGTKGY